MPTDPTSPWWYDDQAVLKLVYAHIAHAQEGGRDLPVRDFVRSFRGLSSTQLAKKVCAVLPGFSHLSALESNPAQVSLLLRAMKQAIGAPHKPEVLGIIGQEPLLDAMVERGGRRWYAVQRWTTAEGLPWCCEVAIAETVDEAGRAVSYGINFSPALGDPLAGVSLRDVNTGAGTAGLFGLLRSYHVLSAFAPRGIRAAVHLSSPAIPFLDRGKARLQIDETSWQMIERTAWKAAKTLYKEGEQQRNAYYRQAKAPVRPTTTLARRWAPRRPRGR